MRVFPHYATKFVRFQNELMDSFDKRFKDFSNFKVAFRFVKDPINLDTSEINELANLFNQDFAQLKVEFDDLASKTDVFGIDPLIELKKYKIISTIYSKILSIYADSYNCESSFSKLNFILNKYRSDMTQEHIRSCLRISTTNIEFDLQKPLRNCQKKPLRLF